MKQLVVTNRAWALTAAALSDTERLEGIAVGGGTLTPMDTIGWFDRLALAALAVAAKNGVSLEDEVVIVLEPHRKSEIIVRERRLDY